MSSRPPTRRLSTAPLPRIPSSRRRSILPENAPYVPTSTRQPKLTNPAAKTQRTSKTSQKLVVLPSEPQWAPLVDDEAGFGGEDAGERRRFPELGMDGHLRSEGERMTKDQREKDGYKRLTAYYVADGIKSRLASAFLKREHGVHPRVFDDAIYVMYHLPLLPGYVSGINVRSSTATRKTSEDFLGTLTEAEENGYDGHYFSEAEQADPSESYIASSPPPFSSSSPETVRLHPPPASTSRRKRRGSAHAVAEMIVFSYGVVVFFNLPRVSELAILEDLQSTKCFTRPLKEDDWEIEQCHFEHDASASKPRVYNDFFTLKSQSHLLKISIAHALAQSTLLARFESLTSSTLSDPSTLSIPRQLATSGSIPRSSLRRRDAMALTGRLFRLRRDINLVSNVLDIPGFFWDEASLGELYGAVREYFEIEERVEELNRKLGVVKELLDMIHEHLNGNAMVRITWIIIWLIVVAIVVELGEALARVVVHATQSKPREAASAVVQQVINGIGNGSTLTRHEVLSVLDRIANGAPSL